MLQCRKNASDSYKSHLSVCACLGFMGEVILKEINVICNHTSQGANVNISFVAVKVALMIVTNIFVANNSVIIASVNKTIISLESFNECC